MMKIVVLDGYTLNPGDLNWAGFEAFGDLTVYDRTGNLDTAARIGNARAVLTNKTAIGKEIIDQCPCLQYIGVLATGYNVVDVVYARERGVIVTNIPDYGATAVAQYVFALLLEIANNVRRHSDSVFEGKWSRCPDFCYWDYTQQELFGNTMGIIGFGRIGKKTAEIAEAFGMQVLYHDVSPMAGDHRYRELKALLEQSDIISLHCPLTPENEGFINKNTLAMMKKGAILINTSRGPLINEQDVCTALGEGRLGAYAADVAATEPIRPDNPLLQAKNCIITPHVAWAAKSARQRLMDIAVSNLEAFIKGSPVNQV